MASWLLTTFDRVLTAWQCLSLLCGVTLLFLGCNSGGKSGELSPQAVRNPRLEQQAVENLLALYRTALLQEDVDRLQELLRPAPAPPQEDGLAARSVTRQEPPATFTAAQLLDTMAATFRSDAVLDLRLTGEAMHLETEPFRVTFQETLSLQDPTTLEQRTQVFLTTWQLTRDESHGTVVIHIAAATREGPLVQVITPGQVVAGAPTRLEVTATFALAGVEVEVPETGERQALVAQGLRRRGVFTPPAQPAPQALRFRVQGQNGAVLEGTHRYRLRTPGEGVVQRLPGTGPARLLAVVVAPDGTVWAGGDGGGLLYTVAPGASTATALAQLLADPQGRVEDLVVDQLGRLHAIVSAPQQSGDIVIVSTPQQRSGVGLEQGIFCQTVNAFDPAYPFRVRDSQTGVLRPSPGTRAVAAGQGDIWLFGSDGGVARVTDAFRTGPCQGAVEVRYAPVLHREDSGLLSNTVPAFVPSADGTLWFGTALGLVRRRDGQFTPVLFRRDLALPGAREIATLETLFQEVAEAIFQARPLSTVALGNVSFVDLFGRPLVKEDIIFSAVDDGQGQLWVGTLGGGLRRISTRGDTPQETLHLTRQEGLGSNIVFALAVGPDQTIWAATEEGVSHLQPRAGTVVITNFSALDGLALPVRDVAVDRQGIAWLATDGGLFRILPQGGSVQGTVLDPTAQPVVGADVVVQGTPFRAVTDATGRFTLLNLPPGPQRLRLESSLAPGGPLAPVVQDVIVTAGEPTLAVAMLPGREASPPPERPSPKPGVDARELVAVSGDGQTGVVGRVLPRPLVVAVRDAQGQPVADIPVTFTITAGNGTLAPAQPVLTDAQGQAAVTLTLGPQTGENQVTATALGLSPVLFTAIGLAAPANLLVKVSGDGQRGTLGTALPAPLVVAVLKGDGTPVADVFVTFTVTTGNGSLATAQQPATATLTVRTDAQGQAAATLTLGPRVGNNGVTVSAPNLLPVTFSATGVAGPPARLRALSGDGAQVIVNTSLSLVVQVTDAFDNPVAGAAVQFQVTTGPGRVVSATVASGPDGQATTTLMPSRQAGISMVTATVFTPAARAGVSCTFTVTALADRATAHLVPLGGNNQLGQPGDTLPQPLVVRLEDQFGNPLVNEPITATIRGDGSIAVIAPSTRALSQASTSVQGVTDRNGEVHFTLRAGNKAEGENDIVTDVAAPTLSQVKSVQFLTIVGEVDTPGIPLDLAVTGDTLLVADHRSGLQVINVKDPMHPSKPVQAQLGGTVVRLALAGVRAYVATNFPLRLYILDPDRIFDENQKVRVLGRVEFADTPRHGITGVTVQGEYAYVVTDARTENTGTLRVIKISNPNSTACSAPLGRFDIMGGRPQGLAVSGSFAYVAAGKAGLLTFNISDPAQPRQISTLPGTFSSHVALANGLAYVVEQKDTKHYFTVLDLSNPAAPKRMAGGALQLRTVTQVAEATAAIAVDDHFAYLVQFAFGLAVIDITHPTALSMVGLVDTPSQALNVTIGGDFLYVSDQVVGVQVFPRPKKAGDVNQTIPPDPRDFPLQPLPQGTTTVVVDARTTVPRSFGNGTQEAPYRSLTDGLRALCQALQACRVPQGEMLTLLVRPGTYSPRTTQEIFPLDLSGTLGCAVAPADLSGTLGCAVAPAGLSPLTLRSTTPEDPNIVQATVIDAGLAGDILFLDFLALDPLLKAQITIEGLTLMHGAHGVFIDGTVQLTLRNNQIMGNIFAGISMSSNANPSNIIAGNTVQNNGQEGIGLSQTAMTKVLDNTVLNNGEVGIVVSPYTTAEVTHNIIMHNGHDGIRIENNAIATVTENTISSNGSLNTSVGGCTSIGNGIIVVSDSQAIIARNTITGSKLEGIDVRKDSIVTVTDNQIIGNVRHGVNISDIQRSPAGFPSRLTVAGNTISANGTGEISFSGISAQNVTVEIVITTNNVIAENTNNGIDLDSTSMTQVMGNEITKNRQGGIVISGQASVVVVTDNRIIGDSSDQSSQNGILVNNAMAEITWNTIRDHHVNGVSCVGAPTATCVVTDNTIEHNGRDAPDELQAERSAGVLITMSHAEIFRNVIRSNRGEGGLVMFNHTSATVQDNEICANALNGVFVRQSSSVTLTDNTVCENAGDGIQVGKELKPEAPGFFTTIRGGTITQNTGNGVFVVNHAQARIGLDGGVVMVTKNEGAGIFVDSVNSDASAEIDCARIIFQDNKGGNIVGSVSKLHPSACP